VISRESTSGNTTTVYDARGRDVGRVTTSPQPLGRASPHQVGSIARWDVIEEAIAEKRINQPLGQWHRDNSALRLHFAHPAPYRFKDFWR
jgi:hypothetical protein